MSRGDRREDIFLDDVDPQDFLKTLAKACQKASWQVHAYCLMRKSLPPGVGNPQPQSRQRLPALRMRLSAIKPRAGTLAAALRAPARLPLEQSGLLPGRRGTSAAVGAEWTGFWASTVSGRPRPPPGRNSSGAGKPGGFKPVMSKG